MDRARACLGGGRPRDLLALIDRHGGEGTAEVFAAGMAVADR
jgi:hypothetical protein